MSETASELREKILSAPKTGPTFKELEELAASGDEEAKKKLETISKSMAGIARATLEQMQRLSNAAKAITSPIIDALEEDRRRREAFAEALKNFALPKFDFKIPSIIDNTKEILKSKVVLSDLYNKYDLKPAIIANIFDVPKSTINYHFKRNNIEVERSGGNNNFVDMTGQKFDRLEVIERAKVKKNGAYWICKCECGKVTKPISRRSLISSATKSCGCLKKDLAFEGCGDLSLSYWSRINKGATKRGIGLEISIEDAWEKYQEQNGKCALTGLEIKIVTDYTKKHQEHTASLDRIDNNYGYTKNNIQWVHRDINMMRRTMSTERFIELCKKVAEHEHATSRPEPFDR